MQFDSMTSEGKLSVSERVELIKTLNSLPGSQFNELVFALDPPPEIMSAASAAQGDRAPVLLDWVEKTKTGPGLAKLREVLNQVLGRLPEPSDSPSNASFIEDLGKGVTLDMIHIPEGVFWMGSPESEEGRYDTEGPRHRVSVPAFFMGKYLVTQRQWRSVSLLDDVDMELNPDSSDLKGGKRPVECVSWYEAAEFCARLSKHRGKAYRLPSEAEWEYACRAGTITPSHFGARISTDLANISGHYQGTTEVDKFGANAFGLYDMHGNVWEWCLDHWHDNYEGAPTDGSAWLSPGKGIFRVYRGGSWGSNPRYCRSACRKGGPPVNRNGLIGFRVCCSAPRILP